MLVPDKNRLDYGEQLIAPEGYELTHAIATTYSLDLNTLLTVPIAMCFGHTLEGSVEHMRIALLEALGMLGDKLTVFYQQGNIKLPDKYNSLFGLLENSLYPVVPNAGESNSAFSSFHPKLWLLRFKSPDENQNVKYRLIVLSRNLTFDRSWDLSAVINGESRGKRKPANWSLVDFFDEVYRGSSKQSFDDVIDPQELVRVHWDKPDNISELGFLSTIFDDDNKRQRPVHLEHGNQTMLAVSPFIRGGGKVGALDWLSTFVPDGQRYLFSRKEELDIAGEKALDGWHCYALNEHLIDAEENEEMDQSPFVENDLNLHAKLLVVDETDSTSSWHLGSANTTQAAMGDASNSPRNNEFMLRLTGSKDHIGVHSLIKQWVNEHGIGLFTKHEFSELEENENEDEDSDRALRLLEFSLISADWELEVDLSGDDEYQLTLNGDLVEIPPSFDVKVSTLSASQPRALARGVIWDSFKPSQISALIHFEISENDSVVKNLIVQAEIKFHCKLDRRKAITNELLENRSQFMSYIAMLLHIDPSKQDLMNSAGKGDGEGAGGLFFTKDSVIYEKLMRAAALSPDLLERIDRLQAQVDEKIIPDEFKTLWGVFSSFVPSK
ncbi:phospholipase D family protein [Vibrio parahaemolyticus]|nr:phospholipase D family protein [Vibrio parahaemolyticus]EIV1892411.1 phospholipase D family protein [Vibrio parahaemolyticus]